MTDDWSYMWCERKDDFVLLKVRGDDYQSIEDCLIYDVKDHSMLIIEDDQLAHEIMERMKSAGVPIVPHTSYPPGLNPLEQLINEMLEAGKGPGEINSAIREYEQRSKNA